ncbi:WXG100 family type VII secretion target [Mycobacterium sp. AZCC_0083]|uniref:WXG100 family type VII secretion target n=1 Tax=Mycobacterium sp. AZCC_0083 TaxID=2735882 RepID=UPI00161B3548|nr:WXG100 family type VII secretion target [Mycobacterium sp. AZCC_0083]MBB5167574.1 uncharacterized protein YukE [Mycobacterium sp. AZCC_0083]
MTEPFHVTPDELRSTATDLANVSSRISQVMSTLRASLDGEGAPWGDDSVGHNFANGGGGYLAQMAWVNDSVNAKIGLLTSYSESLRTAADTLESQDHH